MHEKASGKGRRRDVVKEWFWGRMIKKIDREGITVRAFCQKHEISEHQFYSWRREIKRRDQNEPRRMKPKVRQDAARTKSERRAETPSIFTPVTIIADPNRAARADGASQVAPIEVVLDDIIVRVPSAASRESLVMVLSALDVLGQSRC